LILIFNAICKYYVKKQIQHIQSLLLIEVELLLKLELTLTGLTKLPDLNNSFKLFFLFIYTYWFAN